MKRLLALFLLCFSLVLLVSCAITHEGYEPEAGNTVTHEGYEPEAGNNVIEETEHFLFSPDSPVKLTAEEENEIIFTFATQNNDPAPDVSKYTVRCYGSATTDEYGKVYAVVIEKPNYEPIVFDEYFESPYDYPVTREYQRDAYDVWSDMRAPLLIYANGEFFAWKDSPVTGEFLTEILDIYRRYNEDFYNVMDGK